MSTAGTKHIDQSIPIEWHAMEYDEQTFVVRDVPEGTAQLFAVVCQTDSVRVLASANAAIYDGKVVSTYYDHDTRTVEFYHDFAGTVDRHGVDEWLDVPAIKLSKIRSGSGDLMDGVR